MRNAHRIRLAAGVIAVMLGAAAAGCGSDKSTNPPPSGNLEMNSGDIAATDTYSHTFSSAGNFGYHCTRHSGMTGSVTVLDTTGPALANVSIVSNAFNPATATVRKGGRVPASAPCR